MKTKFTILIILVIQIFIVSISTQAQELESDYQIHELSWKTDSSTVKQIIEELLPFIENDLDTDIGRKIKNKKFALKLKEIIDKNKGKKIQFQTVRVKDIKPEYELTKFGIQKGNEYICELKKNPLNQYIFLDGEDLNKNTILKMFVSFYLVTCKECFKETGNYNLETFIPNPYNDGYQPDSYITGIQRIDFGEVYDYTIEVEINKIISNENQIKNLNKNSFIPLTGKFLSMDFFSVGSLYKVKLFLE